VLGAKIRAILEGRFNVAFEDIREVALPALRHRVILNFEADAEGFSADRVIQDVLLSTKEE
jgi:MoxR-like ATPase